MRRDPNLDHEACLSCAGLGRVKVDREVRGPEAWVTCLSCDGSGVR